MNCKSGCVKTFFRGVEVCEVCGLDCTEADYKQLFIDAMEELGSLDFKTPQRLSEMWEAYDDAVYSQKVFGKKT